jgi:hypothetical protein
MRMKTIKALGTVARTIQRVLEVASADGRTPWAPHPLRAEVSSDDV